MQKISKTERVIKNAILFIVGFCAYITIETLFRGYSFWMMGVCGGLAVLLLDKLNDCISWDMDLLLQSAIGSVLITFFEYVIGSLYLLGLLPQMWDYSNMPLNYKGIICVPFSLLWMALSAAAIIVADAINYYVFEELPVPYYKIFGKTVIRFKKKKCK